MNSLALSSSFFPRYLGKRKKNEFYYIRVLKTEFKIITSLRKVNTSLEVKWRRFCKGERKYYFLRLCQKNLSPSFNKKKVLRAIKTIPGIFTTKKKTFNIFIYTNCREQATPVKNASKLT